MKNKQISKEEAQAEKDVKDMYADQDRKEYLEKAQEDQAAGGRNPPAVPKSMLEREYTKSPGGGYVHKARGYTEHR